MDDKLSAAAILGLALGIFTTYFGAVLKFKNDLRFEYDKDLRSKRLAEYSALWQLTSLFPKYARESAVTLAQVKALTVQLRDWYFRGGGMYLSTDARTFYFNYQAVLTKVLEESKQDPSTPLEACTYERLRSAGSGLRSSLVRDIGTRKQPELSGKQEA